MRSVTYALRNPFYVDFSNPTRWQQHFSVVPVDDTRSYTLTLDPRRLGDRQYEVFLPHASDTERAWLPLTPTLETTIVNGLVGVTPPTTRRMPPTPTRGTAPGGESAPATRGG